MRQKPLPFIVALEKLAETDPKECNRVREDAARAFIASDGFQLLLSILQTLDNEALSQIKVGERVEHNVGRLQAAEQIRGCIRALLPVTERPDLADSVEEDLLPPYESGFAIPHTGE